MAQQNQGINLSHHKLCKSYQQGEENARKLKRMGSIKKICLENKI